MSGLVTLATKLIAIASASSVCYPKLERAFHIMEAEAEAEAEAEVGGQ
jgi:hypothetical protein